MKRTQEQRIHAVGVRNKTFFFLIKMLLKIHFRGIISPLIKKKTQLNSVTSNVLYDI